MSIIISKRQMRRQRIVQVVATIEVKLSTLLERGGLIFTIKNRQASTGTVYMKILVFSLDGRRCRGFGACIRVADHRAKPSDRWINFSRHHLGFTASGFMSR